MEIEFSNILLSVSIEESFLSRLKILFLWPNLIGSFINSSSFGAIKNFELLFSLFKEYLREELSILFFNFFLCSKNLLFLYPELFFFGPKKKLNTSFLFSLLLLNSKKFLHSLFSLYVFDLLSLLKLFFLSSFLSEFELDDWALIKLSLSSIFPFILWLISFLL